MKHNKKHDNVKSDGLHLESVHFEFTHPTAHAVCISGCFNHWRPETKPMHSMGNGRWLKETSLAPGTYEYCLVVDGQYIPEPLAKDYVPSPFGGRNSILKVVSPEVIHLAAAENLPMKKVNKQKTQKL